MNQNPYIYILIAALVSYMIRVIPLTIFRKPIKNIFIRSFLYYVPYVTLAVMTFPAIIHVTESPLPGLFALIIGIIITLLGGNLFPVACVCCVVVFITNLFIH